jgi:hypothetical protein
MGEYRQTIACPACGGTARVTAAIEVAEDGRAVLRVIRYSCPQHDLMPERIVLAALNQERGQAATGSTR